MTEEEINKRNFRINIVIISLVYIVGITVNIVFLWWGGIRFRRGK